MVQSPTCRIARWDWAHQCARRDGRLLTADDLANGVECADEAFRQAHMPHVTVGRPVTVRVDEAVL